MSSHHRHLKRVRSAAVTRVAAADVSTQDVAEEIKKQVQTADPVTVAQFARMFKTSLFDNIAATSGGNYVQYKKIDKNKLMKGLEKGIEKHVTHSKVLDFARDKLNLFSGKYKNLRWDKDKKNFVHDADESKEKKTTLPDYTHILLEEDETEPVKKESLEKAKKDIDKYTVEQLTKLRDLARKQFVEIDEKKEPYLMEYVKLIEDTLHEKRKEQRKKSASVKRRGTQRRGSRAPYMMRFLSKLQHGS